MAGLIFVVNPPSFWVQFVLSEIVGYLSTQPKEGLLMVIKVLREAKSYVKQQSRNVIVSQGFHLPFRFNLLMIWCDSSEKGENKYNKAIKNRPQRAWAGLANARLLLRRSAR